jgi:glycosyltransferase involved in cell wall biosynthesis
MPLDIGDKMIILSVHNSADIYGASRCLLRNMSLFVRDGHEVHVVLPCRGPLVELLEESGVRIHILQNLSIIDRAQMGTMSGKLIFPFRFVSSTAALIALILRYRVDVVHTNTAVLPTAPLAATLTGRRSVFHLREFFSEFPGLWRFYQHYIGLLSSRLIVISSAVEVQFTPRLRSKCTIIYDGLDASDAMSDPEAALALRKTVGSPLQLVGVVGRIKFVRKGQEVLVKAAALLRERFPNVRYLIVGTVSPGNEDHLDRLKELIRANRLEDRFVFTGDISDVRNVYAALDITVVPSIQAEPFGMVVVESMALGTPVVGSRCGGIIEQVVDGETGLLFDPGNEQELAQALACLLENDQLRSSMGRAGQVRVRQVFGIDQTYSRTAACFRGTAEPTQSIAVAS